MNDPVEKQMIAPATEIELAEAIAGAAGSLRVIGGGTRSFVRDVEGVTLSTRGLTGISLYEPGALTLVAAAGTPLTEIEAALQAEDQRLAFEPMDHRSLLGHDGQPTIGGVVAANISGPRRVQAGACRDALLGVRFVDGRGTVIKNGGRVMKNVTGYDLAKLICGSFGTLGVLSEVSLKVLPDTQSQATLVAKDHDLHRGIAALSAALGSPFEVNGAAYAGPGIFGPDPQTMIRIDGRENSVSYRAAQLALGGGWDVLDGEASKTLWQEIRDVAPFADMPGAVWKISLTPGFAPDFINSITNAGVDHRAIFDWGGGLIWLWTPEIDDCGASVVRQQTRGLGGHATLIRGQAAGVSIFQTDPAPLAKIATGIKAQFDPRGILNPGIMGL